MTNLGKVASGAHVGEHGVQAAAATQGRLLMLADIGTDRGLRSANIFNNSVRAP